MNTTLLALAILPVIVLGFYVYRKDRFQKEPVGMLLKAFFMGCLSVVPAILLEQSLTMLYQPVSEAFSPAVGGLYTGFVVAGCSEELCKLLLLSWAVWRSRHFDEYFDGIVYATFVSLGFAGVENVMYVFSAETYSHAIMTGSMRAILSVPAHFLFGVAMGYFFALAKFDPSHRGANLFKAFLVPMLLHGTFDSLLMVPAAMGEDGGALTGALFIAFIIFDIKLWRSGMKKLRELQDLSGYQAADSAYDTYNETYSSGSDDTWRQTDNDRDSKPFDGFNWDV